jgi:hypothetical protein
MSLFILREGFNVKFNASYHRFNALCNQSDLAGHPVRTELPEAEWRGDLAQQSHHVDMLDFSLHSLKNS